MKTNSNYLIANQDRFINKTLYTLKEDSKPSIFEKYKKAMKEFKKEDKLSVKIPLYKEAVKASFRGSLATVTQKKLTKIIEKKKKKEPELEIEFVDEPMKYKLYLSFFTNPLTEDEVVMKRGRKNPLGLEHYMNEEGDRFQHALSFSDKADWQEVVESTEDLIEKYQSGYMIQHYVDNVVNGEITKKWKKFFEDLGQSEGREFDNRLDTIIESVRYIRVDQIDHVDEFKEIEEKEKKKLLKKKMIKQKNYDTSACSRVYPWIKIDYDRNLAKNDVKLLFKPTIESNYLQTNRKERACVFDILIEAYAEGFIRMQKKNKRKNIQELTYDYLMKQFDFEPDETDMGLSLDILIEKWFKPRRLALVVFDKFEGVICKYHPSDDGKKINLDFHPHCLYLLATNQHLERCNDQLKTLQQIATKKDNMHEPIQLSDNFHLPKEQNKTPHILIDHFYEIRNIRWDEIKGKRLNITVQQTSLANVYSYLRDVCHIMPSYEYKGHDIMSSLTFKVDYLTVTVRNPDNDLVLGQLQFKTDDNNEQYDTFQDLKFRMNASLMNSETLSQFNELDILIMCAPKALKYRIRNDLETTHYVDKIKAYTDCLLKLDVLAVANKFDLMYDYSEYADEPFRNNYFYLVQRMNTSGLCDKLKNVFLMQEFTIFRGYELKNRWEQIKNNVQILGCYTVTNLVDNTPAKDMIAHIYESDILTEKQKKFIINMPTGMVEKSSNKDKRCVLIEDRYEAEALAMKYGATVTPFRYELTGDITDQEYVEMRNALPWNFSWIEEYVCDTTEEDWYSKVRQQKKAKAEREKNQREIWSVELSKKKPLAIFLRRVEFQQLFIQIVYFIIFQKVRLMRILILTDLSLIILGNINGENSATL